MPFFEYSNRCLNEDRFIFTYVGKRGQVPFLLDPRDEVSRIIEGAYGKIHAEAHLIPKSTEIMCVVVEHDELIFPEEADDIIQTLGRGYFILDKQEKADKSSGRLAHDMDNLTPAAFLNLVSLDWRPTEKRSAL